MKLTDLPIIKPLRQSVGLQRFMLVTGLTISVVFLLTALFAPLISPYGFSQLLDANNVSFGTQRPPGTPGHLLGTTSGGFDVLSRVIWGAQTALIVMLVAVAASMFLGVLVGTISGYFGGWLDRVLVTIADAIYSFPSLLLAILLSIMINQSGTSAMSGILAAGVSITVVFVPQYFRVIRSEVMQVKNEPYVEFSQISGTSIPRILTRHVLRNSTRTLPIVITMNAAESILTLAGLGFLGLGIQPSAAAEWGYDLNKAISDVTSGIWWTALFPGIAIVLIVAGVTFLGEGLNDLSDPRLRLRRKPTPLTPKATK